MEQVNEKALGREHYRCVDRGIGFYKAFMFKHFAYELYLSYIGRHAYYFDFRNRHRILLYIIDRWEALHIVFKKARGR